MIRKVVQDLVMMRDEKLFRAFFIVNYLFIWSSVDADGFPVFEIASLKLKICEE